MKELLNKLIEKGRKPRWKRWKMEFSFMLWWWDSWVYELNFLWWEYPIKIPVKHSIRELVAKESWLWQFVCENGMVKMKEWYYWQNIALIHSEEYDYCDYQFWLIESSLKDESELEQFLLDNINIDD